MASVMVLVAGPGETAVLDECCGFTAQRCSAKAAVTRSCGETLSTLIECDAALEYEEPSTAETATRSAAVMLGVRGVRRLRRIAGEELSVTSRSCFASTMRVTNTPLSPSSLLWRFVLPWLS
ncbi:hypothetical protein DQ04_22011000 [Trypanosoma grayi]|uniref:hypothetical protein n=1 Tax=Trypanosoma grayi TaxID=71804 RepID=UPI0004F4462C|nr:hypothetical protein DQ04_22011000 [Trypanosoma grayi]KEG05435.1 hypothetical protein DQ04_22011000 [Trypanosoma grayi]